MYFPLFKDVHGISEHDLGIKLEQWNQIHIKGDQIYKTSIRLDQINHFTIDHHSVQKHIAYIFTKTGVECILAEQPFNSKPFLGRQS